MFYRFVESKLLQEFHYLTTFVEIVKKMRSPSDSLESNAFLMYYLFGLCEKGKNRLVFDFLCYRIGNKRADKSVLTSWRVVK